MQCMLLVCRQLEADDRSTSVLPSPLRHPQISTAVSADSVGSVALPADSNTVLSNVGQYQSVCTVSLADSVGSVTLPADSNTVLSNVSQCQYQYHLLTVSAASLYLLTVIECYIMSVSTSVC